MPFKLLQVIEQSGVLDAPGLTYNNTPAVVTTAVGQMVKFYTCFWLLCTVSSSFWVIQMNNLRINVHILFVCFFGLQIRYCNPLPYWHIDHPFLHTDKLISTQHFVNWYVMIIFFLFCLVRLGGLVYRWSIVLRMIYD